MLLDTREFEQLYDPGFAGIDPIDERVTMDTSICRAAQLEKVKIDILYGVIIVGGAFNSGAITPAQSNYAAQLDLTMGADRHPFSRYISFDTTNSFFVVDPFSEFVEVEETIYPGEQLTFTFTRIAHLPGPLPVGRSYYRKLNLSLYGQR